MLPNESYLPSTKPYRSRAWLSAVHEVEQCFLCGAWGIQAPHSNQDHSWDGPAVIESLTMLEAVADTARRLLAEAESGEGGV